MDTGMIVNLVISGIILLFVLSGMFWGLIRGLRKTVIRSIWLIITAVILVLFLSSVITNIIVNINFTINIDGTEVNGLRELITHFISSSDIDMAKFGETIDAVVNTIIAYIALLLNSIVFVLLFWILKTLLLPVNWALSKWVFISKKERQYRKDLKAYKAYVAEYNRLNKGKKRVEAVGFASGEDDIKLVEDDLKEVKEEQKKNKSLESLKNARKAFDDMMARVNQEKQYKNVGDNPVENNELVDRPYQEESIVEETVEEEETFVPSNEYEPKVEEQKVELKPVVKPKKPKKHRFFGMLVGGMLGLFISAVTFSPAIGLMNVAEEINSKTEVTLEDDTTIGILDYVTDGVFGEINAYYRDAIGTNVLTYTGSEWVATTTFKMLTRANIDGVNTDLTKDASTIIAIVNEVNIMSENIALAQENNYEVPTMSKIIGSAEKICDQLFEISIISVLSEPLIDVMVQMLEEEIDQNKVSLRTTGEEEIELDTDQLLQDVVDGLKAVDSADKLEKELKALINVLNMLNSGVSEDAESGTGTTSLLREILKSSSSEEESKIIEVIQKLNYEYYNKYGEFYFTNLVNNVYSHDGYNPKIATSIMPTTMDYVFKLVLNELNVGTIDVKFETNEQIRTMLTGVFDETFKILLHFNTVKDEQGQSIFRVLNEDTINDLSIRDINIDIFRSIGAIIDNLTVPFTDDEYATLIDGLSESLIGTIEPMFSSLMEEERVDILTESMHNAMCTITKQEGLTNEFEALGHLFNYLIVGESITDSEGKLVEVEPLLSGQLYLNDVENWEIKVANLSAIGNILESMEELKMFGATPAEETGVEVNNTTYFFDSILDKYIRDIEQNIIDSGKGDSLKDLDAVGYINSESVSDFNHVMWNALTRIQRNLNKGAKEQNGSFDWIASLGDQEMFFDFVENLIEETQNENSELFDITADNNILKLLISETYTQYNPSITATKLSVLDTISQSPLFASVVKSMFIDIREMIVKTLPEEVEMKDEITTVIKKMMTTVGYAENNETTYYTYLLTIDKAITKAKDNGLLVDGTFKLEVDSVDSIYAFGEFLDVLVTNDAGIGASAVLDNATVVEVIKSVINTNMLQKTTVDGVEYNTKIESIIKDEKIGKPLATMIKAVYNNIDNITNNNSWANIFGTLIKISNTEFDNMSDTTSALSEIGKILDILTGVEFTLREGKPPVSIRFISNLDATKCLIGLIGNNMHATITDKALLDVIYAVKNEGLDATNKREDFEQIVIGPKDENDAEQRAFKMMNFVGVIENIYNTRHNDVLTVTWETYCSGLAQDIDAIQSLPTEIGQYAYAEQDADGHERNYTYYETTFEGSTGLESNINSLIARDNAILLLDHVKYIIVDKISDEESKITEDCVKNIVENLKDRVQNINEDSLIQEFKALRYFMDFSSSSIDVQDMGKYFDEINNTVLFKDLGKTVATYFIEEVSDIEIDLGDLSGDALREEIDDLNNRIIEILYAHGTSDELEFIKENPDGSYSLNTAPVLDFVEEFNDGNEDLFDKLSEVKDIINSPTGV